MVKSEWSKLLQVFSFIWSLWPRMVSGPASSLVFVRGGIHLQLMTWKTHTCRSGPTGTEKYWSTHATLLSLCPLSLSNGLIFSFARHEETQLFNKESKTTCWTSAWYLRPVWLPSCHIVQEWTRDWGCTRWSSTGGCRLSHSPLPSLSMTRSGSTCFVAIQAGGWKKKPTIKFPIRRKQKIFCRFSCSRCSLKNRGKVNRVKLNPHFY